VEQLIALYNGTGDGVLLLNIRVSEAGDATEQEAAKASNADCTS
jgi:hypothetical protein